MNVDALKAMLRQHEGVKSRPYKDTEGHITIGVGRNLDAKPLKPDEIEYLLSNDVADTLAACATLPWFSGLSENRQLVIADMEYNMGIFGLMKFEKLIAALLVDDYEEAAQQILASQFAVEVGQRARDLAVMMRAG